MEVEVLKGCDNAQKPLNNPNRRRYEEAFEKTTENDEDHIVPEPTFFSEDKGNLDVVLKNCDADDQKKSDQLKEAEPAIQKRITCQVPSCQSSFGTVNECQNHYNARHMHACAICKKSLPSFHILELHVLELHDTLFSLMAEKKPMYQCFLENCIEKFSSQEDRKLHCIQDHNFPKNFQFWQCGPPKIHSNNNNKGNSRKHESNRSKKIESYANGSISTQQKQEVQEVLDKNNASVNDCMANPKNNKDKVKQSIESKSVPYKHIAFGHVPHRAFRKNHSFGVEKTTKQKASSNSTHPFEGDPMDLTDIEKALVAAGSNV